MYTGEETSRNDGNKKAEDKRKETVTRSYTITNEQAGFLTKHRISENSF